ncbi:MAG: hypothetical protein COA43_11180 [Robiginitomaculum sp.]|nr:MAG: hypothetical protein COA43_11180 [Robiginitomaculum sp.]
MSDGSGETEAIEFAGALRTFKFAQGELFKLETQCDESAFLIQQALANSSARTSWVKNVIILGLTGAGEGIADAEGLFKLHMDQTGGNWIHASIVAAMILTRGLSGPVDEIDQDEDMEGNVEGEESRPKN